jgi:hypothetical protein
MIRCLKTSFNPLAVLNKHTSVSNTTLCGGSAMYTELGMYKNE